LKLKKDGKQKKKREKKSSPHSTISSENMVGDVSSRAEGTVTTWSDRRDADGEKRETAVSTKRKTNKRKQRVKAGTKEATTEVITSKKDESEHQDTATAEILIPRETSKSAKSKMEKKKQKEVRDTAT